jgi:hypothetical protein
VFVKVINKGPPFFEATGLVYSTTCQEPSLDIVFLKQLEWQTNKNDVGQWYCQEKQNSSAGRPHGTQGLQNNTI